MRFCFFFLLLVCQLLTPFHISAQISPLDYEIEVLDLNTNQVSLGRSRANYSSENGYYFEVPGRDNQNPLVYYFDGVKTRLIHSTEENLPSFTQESVGFVAAFNDGVLFYVARETFDVAFRYYFHKHGQDSARELDLLITSLSSDFVIIGNRLIGKSSGGSRIISTNGANSGTQILVEAGGTGSADLASYAGGVLAYSSESLYLTDGTQAGTARLGDMRRFPQKGPVIIGDQYFYTASNDLFVFDLTTNTNLQLTTTEGSSPNTASRHEALTASGDRLIFVAENDATGEEVWSSDGTVDGTEVYDRIPGSESGVLDDPLSYFGRLYFEASDTEIFVSDGTAAGTGLALNINEEIANANSWSIFPIAQRDETTPAYFEISSTAPAFTQIASIASPDSPVLSVGFLDGSLSEQTGVQLTDNGLYTISSSVLYYTSSVNNSTIAIDEVQSFLQFRGHIDEKVIFTKSIANFNDLDTEPFAASPEPGSVELLGDLFPSFESSFPSSLFTLNGTRYFSAYNPVTYNTLYTTDGTAAGTQPAIDLYLGTESSGLSDMIVAGGRLFFNKDGNFWASNGTEATSVNLEIEADSWAQIGAVQDTVYFSATTFDGTSSLILRSNGTPTGSQVMEFPGSSPNGIINSSFVMSNNRFYYWEVDRTITGEVTSRLISTNLSSTDRTEALVSTLADSASPFSRIEPVENGLYLFRSVSGGPDEILYLNHETDIITPVLSDAGNEMSKSFTPGAASAQKIVFVERVDGNTNNFTILIDQDQNSFPLTQLRSSPTEEVLEFFEFNDFSILATSQRLIRVNPDNSVQTIYENEKLSSFTPYRNNQLLFSIAQSNNLRNTWITDGTSIDFLVGIGGGYDEFTSYLGDPDYAISGVYIAMQEDFFNTPSVYIYNSRSSDGAFEPQPDPVQANPSTVVAYQGNFYFVATDPLLGREIHVVNFDYAKGVDILAYHDQNENGLRDENEPGIQNIGFSAASATEESRAFTSETGRVEIALEADSTFTVTPAATDCWELISPPASDEVTFRTGEQSTLNYGYRITGDAANLNLLLSSARPRCGFTVPFWLTVQNTGCTLLTGEASLMLPEDVLFVSSVEASVFEDQKVSFAYTNLAPGSTQQFQLFLTMPGEESNGMVIPIQAQAFALNNQADTTASQIFNYAQVLSCAIDPNDKQVLPAREEPSNSNYTQIDETLIYTIRFQNTGTDTAFTVLITDALPRRLDYSTFKPLTASHPYSVFIDDNDAEFLFEDIMLPDSNTNEILSHGFVSFEIKLDTAEAIGATIRNRANIYFDYNSPIRTNRTASAIVEFLDEDEDGFFFYDECDDQNPDANPDGFDIAGNGIDEDCDGEDSPVSTINPLNGTLKISPNPTNRLVRISFSEETDLEGQLFSLLGREIQRTTFRNHTSLDLSSLPTGIYLLRIRDIINGRETTRRVIKE